MGYIFLVATYKSKAFQRFCKSNRLDDETLLLAARSVIDGNVDADLGGGVFKQRVARGGQGKSGSYRTIILYQRGANLFFVFGFARNDRANVSLAELRALKRLAVEFAAKSSLELERAVVDGELIEVMCSESQSDQK